MYPYFLKTFNKSLDYISKLDVTHMSCSKRNVRFPNEAVYKPLTPQVQNMLGGNIRLMAVGAAPIKPAILQFFRAALGALVFEVGYNSNVYVQVYICLYSLYSLCVCVIVLM